MRGPEKTSTRIQMDIVNALRRQKYHQAKLEAVSAVLVDLHEQLRRRQSVEFREREQAKEQR